MSRRRVETVDLTNEPDDSDAHPALASPSARTTRQSSGAAASSRPAQPAEERRHPSTTGQQGIRPDEMRRRFGSSQGPGSPTAGTSAGAGATGGRMPPPAGRLGTLWGAATGAARSSGTLSLHALWCGIG